MSDEECTMNFVTLPNAMRVRNSCNGLDSCGSTLWQRKQTRLCSSRSSNLTMAPKEKQKNGCHHWNTMSRGRMRLSSLAVLTQEIGFIESMIASPGSLIVSSL